MHTSPCARGLSMSVISPMRRAVLPTPSQGRSTPRADGPSFLAVFRSASLEVAFCLFQFVHVEEARHSVVRVCRVMHEVVLEAFHGPSSTLPVVAISMGVDLIEVESLGQWQPDVSTYMPCHDRFGEFSVTCSQPRLVEVAPSDSDSDSTEY